MAALFICSLLVVVTMSLISNPELKPWAWWWFTPMPFLLKYFQKRIKLKAVQIANTCEEKPNP
jgi:uncharacterized protein YybS (DUF2232 family)